LFIIILWPAWHAVMILVASTDWLGPHPSGPAWSTAVTVKA
jgi:hypothetical protein